MNVIMIMVMSLNGKITHGDDPDIYSWTSPEDKDFFFSFLNSHSLIAMGSQTYEAAREQIRLDKNCLRIVLTKNREKYQAEEVPGSIEFSNEGPNALIKRLEHRGFKTMLLVGGGVTNGSFLTQHLVNELYITIEPKIFGSGKDLISKYEIKEDLFLKSVKKLNAQGTLLLHYIVVQ